MKLTHIMGARLTLDSGEVLTLERTGRRLAETLSPQFVQWMAELGRNCGKTTEQIYELWHEYSRTCQAYDQSPIMSEFQDWYKDSLKTCKGVDRG